jgi:hypothetical protein
MNRMNRFVLALALLAAVFTPLSAQIPGGWDAKVDDNTSFYFSPNSEFFCSLESEVAGRVSFDTRVAAYFLEHQSHIPFVEFEFPVSDQNALPPYLQGAGKRWLVLYTWNFMLAYEPGSIHPIAGGFENVRERRYRRHDTPSEIYTASSHLRESDSSYTASNLGLLTVGQPWAEGVPGHGMGESFIIRTPPGVDSFDAVMLSIGFVSYRQPDLYTRNSRPSVVSVLSDARESSFVIELDDTPNPQVIPVPEGTTSVRIAIDDVYPGTHSEDTYVNFAIPLERIP